MDPHSGRIYRQQLYEGEAIETAAEILARGQIPLTEQQATELVKLSPAERIAWASRNKLDRAARKAKRKAQRAARRRNR